MNLESRLSRLERAAEQQLAERINRAVSFVERRTAEGDPRMVDLVRRAQSAPTKAEGLRVANELLEYLDEEAQAGRQAAGYVANIWYPVQRMSDAELLDAIHHPPTK